MKVEKTIKANTYTKIHPIKKDIWLLSAEDAEKEEIWPGKFAYVRVSSVSFNKNQIWKAYFSTCIPSSFIVKRNNVYLEMDEKTFTNFFGKYKVIDDNGNVLKG